MSSLLLSRTNNNNSNISNSNTTTMSTNQSSYYYKYKPLELEEEDEEEDSTIQDNKISDFSRITMMTAKNFTLATDVDAAAAAAASKKILQNFTIMSLLFSANHGCVVACLALATARLGSTIGALQSGIFFLSYTCSALCLGATWVVKQFGSRNAMIVGMGFYCIYVACFYTIATIQQHHKQQQYQIIANNNNDDEYDENSYDSSSSSNNSNMMMMMKIAAYTGATIGGIGAGFLWTAQGSYFTQAAEDYTQQRLAMIRMMTATNTTNDASTCAISTSTSTSCAFTPSFSSPTTTEDTGTNFSTKNSTFLNDAMATIQKDDESIRQNNARGDIRYDKQEEDETIVTNQQDSETEAFLSTMPLSSSETTTKRTTTTRSSNENNSYNSSNITTTSSSSSSDSSTALLAGIFAFWYLLSEVALRLVATISLQFHWASWQGIFGVYTTIAILSTIAMRLCVHNYNNESVNNNNNNGNQYDKEQHESNEDDSWRFDDNNKISASSTAISSTTIFTKKKNTTVISTTSWYKITAAIQLFRTDPKMKYMVGLNAVFGLSSAFINTYVNGEVIPIVLQDPDSKYIGLLTSWSSAVAAGMSLIFAKLATASAVTTTATASSTRNGNTSTSIQCNNNGNVDDDDNKSNILKFERSDNSTLPNNNNNMKGYILTVGAFCFIGVVLPFVLFPDVSSDSTSTSIWGWKVLLFIYSMQGIGRATFEGTLKATFADFFPYEKEGAFANMIVQSGVSSAFGYILSFNLPCSNDVDGNNTNHNKFIIMASSYCVQYRDGSSQYILWFELIVIVTAIVAILGYSRAFHLHTIETQQHQHQT